MNFLRRQDHTVLGINVFSANLANFSDSGPNEDKIKTCDSLRCVVSHVVNCSKPGSLICALMLIFNISKME
jgi:hypothetical protein